MAVNVTPVAVSSELDVTGEERIHVANRVIQVRPSYTVLLPETFVGVTSYYSGIGGSENWFFTEVYSQQEGEFVPLTVDAQPDSVGRGGGWSYDSQHYIVPQDASPYFAFYKRTSTALTRQPSITFTGNSDVGWSAAWNHTSTRLALGMRGSPAVSPFVAIFSRSGDTYTQVAEILDASPTALNRAVNLAYNSTGTKLAVVTNNTDGLSLYNISGDVYTKIVSPGTIPTGQGRSCAFFGEYLAYANLGIVESAVVYKVVGDTLTTVFAPGITQGALGVAWNLDGSKLAVLLGASVKVYSRTGDSFSEITTITRTDTQYLAWTPNRLLVSVENLKKVFVYDGDTLAPIPAEDIVLAHPDMKPTELGLSAVTING